MKTIILYARRNVGVLVLCYLKARGYDVVVISDDEDVLWVSRKLGLTTTSLEFLHYWKYDLFVCVHGDKIIPKENLADGKMVNIHPCLYKYKGHNPIRRYILGKDTDASVESQYLVEEVDGGEVIHREDFTTPICNNYSDFYNVALPYYLKVLDETLKKLHI